MYLLKYKLIYLQICIPSDSKYFMQIGEQRFERSFEQIYKKIIAACNMQHVTQSQEVTLIKLIETFN